MTDTSVLTIVQFAGDFAQTYRALQRGEAETYYAQRHSIDGIAALAAPEHQVVTVCCTAERDYDEVLGPGLRAIGLRQPPDRIDTSKVWQAVRACAPTHLVLRTPMRQLLANAQRQRLRTLVTIADSFSASGWRDSLRNFLLVRRLNSDTVEGVANHGRTSALQLLDLGVDRRKVTAWDWPHRLRPHDHPVKRPATGRAWRLLFVGMLIESKGLGDLIRALPALLGEGRSVELKIVGSGDQPLFERLCAELGLSAQVQFLGRRAHAEVIDLMRECDVAVVPSRHEYPEGFPMTIYEALATRSPIVCSDHPMLVRSLVDAQSALVFAAGNPHALTHKLRTLLDNAALYARLSEQALDTWQSLQLPVEWVDLVHQWYLGPPGAFEALIAAGREDLDAQQRILPSSARRS